MAVKKKTLVLIDSHAVLHRAFHAMPSFTSSKGEPTGALYGFISMFLRMIKDLKPDYLAACFDLPEPTFRHQFYKEYKAKRPKMADELSSQIDKSKDVLDAFEVPVYEKGGFEADDALASIVEQVKNKKDLKTIIVTGDLDALQLVSDNVEVYTMRKGMQDSILYDIKAVKDRYGFGPELVPDFKGLMGDPSDNIIGVVGIGEKTAKILIQNFGSIENIYKKLGKVKVVVSPRIIKILEENKEDALFSKTLATVRRDVPITFSLKDSQWNLNFNKSKVEEIFMEFGFRSLLKRLDLETGFPFGNSVSSNENKKSKIAYWLLDSRRTNSLVEEIPKIEELERDIKEARLSKIFEIELSLINILENMEKYGILLDVGYLKSLSKDYHKKLREVEKKIWKLAGCEFNIKSPKQLGEVLFEKMGISSKGVRKTGQGALSTKFSELEKIEDRHEIIREIFSHRELAKLISTYVDNLSKLADKDNRLHTSFNQTGTTTGRLSSSEPNLQNIPTRTESGRAVRRAFVAPKGWKLVSFDYSQIELRVVASLSQDRKLIQAFSRGEDIHTKVASEVFNVPFDKVDSEMRRRAKVINFGIIYGMGVNSLKKNLDCSKEEAECFYAEYFNDFKGVADYMEQIKKDTRKKGFTETFFGRRRYLPEINASMDFVRKEAERMAINAPIQGTAADIIKIAMVSLDKILSKSEFSKRVFLLLQVHDELVFEIKNDIMKEITPLIKKEMENINLPNVSLLVETSNGNNWGELK
ncbi:DNA polymerase [Patescibacteria group bacterium]